jgi:hypothetical protein
MNVDGGAVALLACPTENVELVGVKADGVNYAGHWTRVRILGWGCRCGQT